VATSATLFAKGIAIMAKKDEQEKPKKQEETLSSAEESRPETSTEGSSIEESNSANETESNPAAGAQNSSKGVGFGHWLKTHRTIVIVSAIILVIGTLIAIPATRYALAGMILKQNFTVEVLDSETKKPVASAAVRVDGIKMTTDSRGRATVRAAVGSAPLEVSKTYYETARRQVLVPILKQKNVQILHIKATGRQVPVIVTDKISGKPIEDVIIVADKTETKTDKDGQAVLVVPADKIKVSAKLSSQGFNAASVEIQVATTQVDANKFTLTPSGIVYFLSNKSGSLDVVKSNLDGSDRKVVLKGTGKEDRRNTFLLASRDWKYLALHSKRDGGEYAKLFLIETDTDKLTVVDEGKATFGLVGWSDDRRVYRVNRLGNSWDNNISALKSYNAAGKKITTLDQTFGSGANYMNAIYENYAESIFALPSGEVVFGKTVFTGQLSGPTDKQSGLYAIRPDGSGRKTLKAFPERNYLEVRPYGPNGVYLSAAGVGAGKSQYFEYEDAKFEPTTEVNDGNFYDAYPTYLWSPSKKQTFWSESRDGKNALFVGDIHGENGKQIAASSEYSVFGWFTDNYVLVSKNSSELYIMPATGGTPLKMTDYYKPEFTFRGYGGGYGGL
jgi:hypothetical protein